jgi:hypothetical protein
MSLVLGVEILGEYKNLTAATKGAQTQLSLLSNRADKISASMNKAFAAIGIGLSFRAIANELDDAAKAAIEDEKSMNLLALAMKNTSGATKEQIAQAEKSIQKMQYSAGVADDKLRPAYQKLFIATKDVTASNHLLQVALDASAATGKDLDAVSQAMAKSLAGSDTALIKLIPSLKGAKDPMAELEATFKGAAAEAANTDPYQRISVIFQDMQEQIGSALLPVLEKFSTWLATPEGQKKLQQIIDLAQGIITKFSELAKWVLDNKDWLVPMVAAIGGVTTAWNTAIKAVEAYQAIAGAIGAIGAGTAGLLTGGAVGAGIGGYQQGETAGQTAQIYGQSPLLKNVVAKPTPAPVVVNVKTTQSAQQIANAISRAQKSSGTSIVSSLGGL